MELIQLTYFKTVARLGKISAAAQELFLSPPALSISISRLEKELGTQLFDRSGNRISLNAQGEIFLRHVNEVFATLDRARNELSLSLLRQKQHVWIATTGSNPWSELILGFSQEYPNYPLTCSSILEATMEDIFSQFTFLLGESEEVPESYDRPVSRIELFEDQPAILVHPDHPLSRLEQVTVSMLIGEHLLLPALGMRRRERLIRLLRDGGVDVDATTTANYIINRSMVEQNVGIAFTTMRSQRTPPANLCVVPLENPLAPWQMCLYWLSDHQFTDAERTFLEYARQFYQA